MDGAGHGLFVEGPQVLERTAATSNDDHFRTSVPVQIGDRGNDLSGRIVALHPRLPH